LCPKPVVLADPPARLPGGKGRREGASGGMLGAQSHTDQLLMSVVPFRQYLTASGATSHFT
jgi:hypothetical protein